MTLNLTADPERVKHLLITARDELKARGWTQGSYGTFDGPKCSVGALAWAETGDPVPLFSNVLLLAHSDACYVLAEATGSGMVINWNDLPGRTANEVTAAYDVAIGLVDAEIARRQSVAQVQEIAHLAGIETQVTR